MYVPLGLIGLVIAGLGLFVAERFLAADHPVRVWLRGVIRRRGFFHFSRLVGLVAIMAAFAALTILYS